MTPQDFKQYLDAARQHGVMSFRLDNLEVVFGPGSEVLPSFGENPTPGGWKSGVDPNLDRPLANIKDLIEVETKIDE